jgi:hypothetical protein
LPFVSVGQGVGADNPRDKLRLLDWRAVCPRGPDAGDLPEGRLGALSGPKQKSQMRQTVKVVELAAMKPVLGESPRHS